MGDAALLEVEGAGWLLASTAYWPVARRLMGGVRLTLAASCPVAFCGHFGVPRGVTRKSEHFVTI